MSAKRLIAASLAGALMAWLIAPQLFSEFASVRYKVVRTPLQATGDQLVVPIPGAVALQNLRTPFAAVIRLRNDAASPLTIRVALDDRELCSAEIGPGASRRLDCAVHAAWGSREDHRAVFSASAASFSLEYLELATHFGALTPGPRHVIIGPRGFAASRPSSPWHVMAVFFLLTLASLSVKDQRLPRIVSIAHLALTTLIGIVLAAVILSRFVTPYALLLSDSFIEWWLVLAALPALVAMSYWLVTKLSRPALRPLLKAIAVGLVVGAAFQSYVAQQTAVRHEGNVSGLLWISERNFDRSPIRNDVELRNSVRLYNGSGYDGQFFYFIALDPFLRMEPGRPWRYEAYIDTPPYRYGRVGFSALTQLLSGNRPVRFPATMVAIVIVSLALCGALLSLIAQHHGRSAWYGGLIVAVPGFWQSVWWTLPEPLAITFILGAWLCVIRRHWVACGVLLGLCMLVKETSGVFVLAIAGGMFLSGKRREGAVVALLAFVPILLWKGFVGWVFWPRYGLQALMPHPDDVGLPLAGVWHLWTTIASGGYFDGAAMMTSAGIAFPVLSTVGAALALMCVAKRASSMAAAAAAYAVLTLTFNYKSVWLFVGNAERLSIDLFVALALTFLQMPSGQRGLRKTFAAFWCAAAVYVFFLAHDASVVRDGLVSRIAGAF